MRPPAEPVAPVGLDRDTRAAQFFNLENSPQAVRAMNSTSPPAPRTSKPWPCGSPSRQQKLKQSDPCLPDAPSKRTGIICQNKKIPADHLSIRANSAPLSKVFINSFGQFWTSGGVNTRHQYPASTAAVRVSLGRTFTPPAGASARDTRRRSGGVRDTVGRRTS
jgi:hypothetical protein